MDIQQKLLEIEKDLRPGTFRHFRWRRELRLKDGREVIKRTSCTLRLGHSYYNQKEVAQKHETGERQICGLPDWAEAVSKTLIRNKKTGRIYLRGQPMEGAKTSYELNGRKVSYGELESVLYAKDKERDEKPDHITVGIEQIEME